MNTYRKTAILVGVLFIIGTAAGVLSVIFTNPILNAPDYLVNVSANANQIIIGALLVLTMGLALAMVPVLMFPILKKQNEALAMGYVVFRGALETFTYLAIFISWLLLVALSQGYARAGTPETSSFQALGAILLKSGEISANTTAIVFPLGALMFYYVMYRSKLIPRWLSVWGVIGVILNLITTGLLPMFGLMDQTSTIQTISNLPIFLQEMVMAVWMIVRGFK